MLLDGRTSNGMETSTHIHDSKQAESLLTAERRTLETIAGGATLTDVLENLCKEIDAQSQGAMSSVMLMDRDRQRLWPTPRTESGLSKNHTGLSSSVSFSFGEGVRSVS